MNKANVGNSITLKPVLVSMITPADGLFNDHIYEKKSLVEQQNVKLRLEFSSHSSHEWQITLCHFSCRLSFAIPGFTRNVSSFLLM